jgi:hypothetical protein
MRPGNRELLEVSFAGFGLSNPLTNWTRVSR